MAILRHRSNHSGDAKKPILVIVLVLLASCSAFADLPNTVPAAISLWSNGAPGSEARAAEPEEVAGDNVSNIHNPTLTPYVPERE